MHATQLLVSLTSLVAATSVYALKDSEHMQQVLAPEKDSHQVRKELKEAEIIPTVIDEFLPSFLVDAEWSSSNFAQLGNTLKPKKLQDAPQLTLASTGSSTAGCRRHTPNMTYTIIMTDPDAPSRDDPKWSEFCHWIATGLSVDAASSSGSESTAAATCAPQTLTLSDLDEVMPYYPPGPPEKTGKHRYVLIVFAPENGTTEALHLSKPQDRKHWGYEYEGERVGVRRWAKENGLTPVAANFIYAQNKKQ